MLTNFLKFFGIGIAYFLVSGDYFKLTFFVDTVTSITADN